MIRCLLVDDEPLANAYLRTLLGNHADISVIGDIRDGREAVQAIRDTKPDAVFLDVQMADLDGFGVVHEIGVGAMPAVIFVTAYSEFAVNAFRVHALDYLLKPLVDAHLNIALDRLRESLRRARSHELEHRLRSLLDEHSDGEKSIAEARRKLELRRSEAEMVAAPYVSRLAVRSGRRSVIVNAADIDWIEANDYCATLHLGEKRHSVRETLSSLAGRLNPAEFLRIHRSAIVNLSRIATIETHPLQGQYLVLTSGVRLAVSRHGRERLQAQLGKPR